jgi:hypothetical protein
MQTQPLKLYLVVALNTMLRRFDADPEAFTAIIHGAGRAFSTGADVHQRQLRKREEFERLGGPQGHGAHATDLFVRSVNWKPVIAATHGYVMGLAFGIMIECDLIVAESLQLNVTRTREAPDEFVLLWIEGQLRNRSRQEAADTVCLILSDSDSDVLDENLFVIIEFSRFVIGGFHLSNVAARASRTECHKRQRALRRSSSPPIWTDGSELG